MFCASRTYNHAVSAAAVDLEARQMEAALRLSGYNPRGLDLTHPAAQRLADEAVGRLGDINITVVQRVWTRTVDGGAEVAIEVARELDVALAALALS
jgi:hypothetical protein